MEREEWMLKLYTNSENIKNEKVLIRLNKNKVKLKQREKVSMFHFVLNRSRSVHHGICLQLKRQVLALIITFFKLVAKRILLKLQGHCRVNKLQSKQCILGSSWIVNSWFVQYLLWVLRQMYGRIEKMNWRGQAYDLGVYSSDGFASSLMR